jgi:hypothetical protein
VHDTAVRADSAIEETLMPKKSSAGDHTAVTMRVRVGDAEIEVTGPPDFVKGEINEFLQRAPATSGASASTTRMASQSALSEPKQKTKSPAQFFKLCNARSDVDRTLVGAYFLEKYRNAQNASAGEIRDVIREAKVPPPRNVNDSVNQNIRKGLLMSAGDRENKMVFVLTSDGEIAVEQMAGESES